MVALVIVDVQNDFVEGGSLAVQGGEQVALGIAETLNGYLPHEGLITTVVTSQDWHNPLPDTNSGHFATGEPNYVTDWPVHCVAGTEGAKLHPALESALPAWAQRVYKGQGRDDYSAAQGKTEDGVSLAELLKDEISVEVVGLAYDHCVKATAIDLAKLGFSVVVNTRLSAAVSTATALKASVELGTYGVRLVGG